MNLECVNKGGGQEDQKCKLAKRHNRGKRRKTGGKKPSHKVGVSAVPPSQRDGPSQKTNELLSGPDRNSEEAKRLSGPEDINLLYKVLDR